MEEKFKPLYEALQKNEADILIVHHPEVLGDNYEELIYNLNKISDSEKKLLIVPTSQRYVTHEELR